MDFPDLYTVTACELQNLLSSGKYTTVDLVHAYLKQINRHNHEGMRLHSVIVTAPYDSLIEQAKLLDQERAQKKLRSKGHGIPIIVKDNTCTGTLGMPTTSGTLGLAGLQNTLDASLVTALRNAGCIVIAKANLSELGNMKGTNIMSGWSGVGGQTQSPYVHGGVDGRDRWLGHSAPGGSSSGSAVSVAAGFVPWSIGTETDGSVVFPATRAGLYSLKVTVGTVDMTGTQPAGNTFISPGGLTKSVADLAVVTSILLPNLVYQFPSKPSWENLKLAFVKPQKWRFPEEFCEFHTGFLAQTETEMEIAIHMIESLGANVARNAPLETPEDFFDKRGYSSRPLAIHQARPCLENFFSLFEPRRLRSLEDLVKFNEEHADRELPPENSNQDYLIDAVADTMSDDEFVLGMRKFRSDMREAVEQCLDACNADVIIAPGDSLLTTVAMGAGYPIASVPLGFADLNGRPYGLLIMGRSGEEAKILDVMAAWETTFCEGRKPPSLMQEWDNERCPL